MKNSVFLKNININNSDLTTDDMLKLKYTFLGDVTGIYNSNNELVGLIDLDFINNNKDVYIEQIEIFQSFQKQGYLKLTIDRLKYEYPTSKILGYADSDDSRKIWAHLGAIFNGCHLSGCKFGYYNICPKSCNESHSFKFYFSDLPPGEPGGF